MNWATFLATFSQSHLVTLASAHVSLQQKQKFVKYSSNIAAGPLWATRPR
jgi:hypothetical protein